MHTQGTKDGAKSAIHGASSAAVTAGCICAFEVKARQRTEDRGKSVQNDEVQHTYTHLIQSATVISKHKESDLFRQPHTALSDGTSMAARGFIMPWLLVST